MTDFNTIPPASRMSRFTRREGVILDGWYMMPSRQ